MKRLFILALFAVAGWYGWQHRDTLFGGNTDSEAVIVNSGTHAMLRVRLTVEGKTYVRDVIEPEGREVFPVAVTRASDFRLRWEWQGLEGAPEWRGGEIAPGTTRTRCTLQVFADNDVTVNCVPMPAGPDVR